MNEAIYPEVTIEHGGGDYGPLPEADGKEHTAFPANTRRMMVDWFVGGRSVEYLADWFKCDVADIEHVLRVALGYKA